MRTRVAVCCIAAPLISGCVEESTPDPILTPIPAHAQRNSLVGNWINAAQEPCLTIETRDDGSVVMIDQVVLDEEGDRLWEPSVSNVRWGEDNELRYEIVMLGVGQARGHPFSGKVMDTTVEIVDDSTLRMTVETELTRRRGGTSSDLLTRRNESR